MRADNHGGGVHRGAACDGDQHSWKVILGERDGFRTSAAVLKDHPVIYCSCAECGFNFAPGIGKFSFSGVVKNVSILLA